MLLATEQQLFNEAIRRHSEEKVSHYNKEQLMIMNSLFTKEYYQIRIILVLLMCFVSSVCFSQKAHKQQQKGRIDSLKTEADVKAFMDGNDDYFKSLEIIRIQEFTSIYSEVDYCQSMADSLGIEKSHYKTDFDDNGMTDLMVFARDRHFFQIFTFFSYPKDSIRINYFSRKYYSECEFPVVKKDGTIELTHLNDAHFSYDGFNWNFKGQKFTTSELIYNYGNFIERNLKPSSFNITKIEYTRSGCHGTCPMFSYTLIKDGNSKCHDMGYFFEESIIGGYYKTQIKNEQWEELTSMLNYLDFQNLSEKYSLESSHGIYADLTIFYNNGQQKKIADRGINGTFGLRQFHNLLLALRDNQDWNKLSKSDYDRVKH